MVCRYWTLPQMVAHHTVGGCNLRPGDLLGTGTISCNSVSPSFLGRKVHAPSLDYFPLIKPLPLLMLCNGYISRVKCCETGITVSGDLAQADKQGLGCLLEKTWNSTKPMSLADGTERLYLEDGDTVTLCGYCQGPGYRVGFGDCMGKVLPSRT